MTANCFPEEHVLRLRIADMREVALLCTCDALHELVTGYLYNEGVIASPNEIASLTMSPDGGEAAVELSSKPQIALGEVRASGLGGAQLVAECEIERKPLARRFSAEYIRQCAAEMEGLAVRHAATGGVHCSALFDGEKMLSCFEDIGRHNTLDKLAGDCLLRDVNASDTLLITTGRISSDMVRKAARMGASALASYSTATRRAFEAASAANVTLIGYIRRAKSQVFCSSERII